MKNLLNEVTYGFRNDKELMEMKLKTLNDKQSEYSASIITNRSNMLTKFETLELRVNELGAKTRSLEGQDTVYALEGKVKKLTDITCKQINDQAEYKLQIG